MLNNNKYKYLIWTIIALIALNLSMVGTVAWQVYKSKNDQQAEQYMQRRNKSAQHGMAPLFIDKVGFDDQQMMAFKEKHQAFRSSAKQTADVLNELRLAMMGELAKEKPDTMVLNNLSEQIGKTHSDLKRRTYRFYLDMKAISRPEQQGALKEVFNMFMQSEMPGRGQGPNRQMRNGKRNQNMNPRQ